MPPSDFLAEDFFRWNDFLSLKNCIFVKLYKFNYIKINSYLNDVILFMNLLKTNCLLVLYF